MHRALISIILFLFSSISWACTWTTNSAYPASTQAASCTAFSKATWDGGGTGRIDSPTSCTPIASNGAAGPSGVMASTGCAAVPPPNTCTAKTGIPRITNFTLGYARTDGLGPNSGDSNCVAGCATSVPASICDAGCVVSLGAPVAGWRSTAPTNNGLFRDSVDFTTVPTGSQCTMSSTVANNPANPAIANPACPGFVGEVNGKTQCVGTAEKPIPTNPLPKPGTTPAPGNPAAGEKPATGEGSGTTGAGRTPSTGTGGSSGGPAASAVGPTGSTPLGATGTVQQACGAPGQPKCGIDESGTVNDGKAYDASKTALDAAETSSKNSIGNAASIQAPSWSFAFQLPTGCSPYVTGIKAVVLDVCQYQPTIHGLLSLIWAAATAFGMIGMVGRTIREA